ncbi:hypothetical protein ALC60_01860 [Trachymyrmex zeteki]|uniref:Uncharacterized protein n=1 Tax=Mycetomoellerius zeteki TaxID=64791 RepID=A0A151XFG1_9HYME|nr:hypothetical protein ALC60_01860 [Trachymyrmex zeteki]
MLYIFSTYLYSSFFNSTPSHTSSTSCHTPYVLSRRFALTSYKYLDIGISVGLMSYVKIVIGDNRGNRIILLHTTWKAFIERCANVERLVQSTVSSFLMIQDLIVELVKIGNEYDVKISLYGTCLHMKPKTMLFV